MFGINKAWMAGTLGSFTGKVEMLVGLVSLGLATTLLRFYVKKRGTSQEADRIMGVTSALAGATIVMLLSRRFTSPHRKPSGVP